MLACLAVWFAGSNGCGSDRLDEGDPSDAAEAGRADAGALPGQDASADSLQDSDADAGCACTTIDAKLPVSVTSLPCFCATTSKCEPYDLATQCEGHKFKDVLVVEKFADCDYINVRVNGPGFSSWRVYSATTHELVGTRQSIDTASLTCGPMRASLVEAGINPYNQGCHPIAQTLHCWDGGFGPKNDGAPPVDADAGSLPDVDGSPPKADVHGQPPVDDAHVAPPDVDAATDANPGPDADAGADAGADGVPPNGDADAGCTCTPDRGGMGHEPLACYCSRNRALCPDFATALHTCPDSPLAELNRIDTYAACNLLVITIKEGLGQRLVVYDATTQELVGGSFASDTNESVCSTVRVFGYQGGTFPPPECVLSETTPRCLDAGGGGNDPKGSAR